MRHAAQAKDNSVTQDDDALLASVMGPPLAFWRKAPPPPVHAPPAYLGMSYASILTDPVTLTVLAIMLTVYLALRFAFARNGSWFSTRPAFAAHGFTFCLPFVYLATMGIYHWYGDPSLAVIDRTFGVHPAAKTMSLVMVGTQLYDIPSSILIGGELASPNFVAHHITVLTLCFFALHYQFLLYYGVYFMGVIELSTPLLVFVDLFRDNPKFAQAFKLTNELVRVLFAVAFFAVRIVLWIPASLSFWTDALDLLATDDPASRHGLPVAVIVFWLIVHLGLTCLQWHWGIMILKAVYYMAIGDEIC